MQACNINTLCSYHLTILSNTTRMKQLSFFNIVFAFILGSLYVTIHAHNPDQVDVQAQFQQTKVEAAIMYKILTHYAILANNADQLTIGLVGSDKLLVKNLKKIARQSAKNGQELLIKMYDNESDALTDFDALFISDTQLANSSDLLSEASDLGIITFTAMQVPTLNPPTQQATINFVLHDNKMRFTVKHDALGNIVHPQLWDLSLKQVRMFGLSRTLP